MGDRLPHARALIAHIALHLQADCSVELWNREVLPLGRDARDDIRIVIASPAAIGRLVRSPRLTTLVEVYLAGGIDITGGSPLEALGRWEHLRAVHLKRHVDRALVLRHALPFLRERTPEDAGLGFAARVKRIAGRGRDDQAMIQFHYDVSNAFYALFLGEEMQYSSAVFADVDEDLDVAQRRKLDLICTKLRLAPGKRLLDIGCGWGGLAAHAADHYGATVHGVTLSAAQLEAARARTERFGDRVTLELRDYRTLDAPESYDAIAQIGMFEHVGIDNHDTFFAQMARLLTPGGLYLHQATTRRATRDLSKFRRQSAYMKVINRWIFPGGELDYVGMTATNVERWGFEVRDVETMREHYHLTLKAWSERLYARRDEASTEAGVTRTRLWLLYFALSCMGFWRGVLCDFQTLAQKKVTGLSGLPLR
ncbi:cyclopropane-fatty-acyl-phospholipid synthase family protein [Sphingomonas sp. SUN019]|uniref:SAM-dependent methyltransferase n=1 Tax=Sphingomonas sp. SUN019 TaxID=2937788 RepID=UPI0021642DF7|nr:cyclopropane-fatty-acyl-phospholipid synthase family protein [Sphingomonas sp. SUN019]UVO49574.1 cyclopropane-fatty-acyl-phospholipid synthase family protein [Sphingomonas sp. SUN019]